MYVYPVLHVCLCVALFYNFEEMQIWMVKNVMTRIEKRLTPYTDSVGPVVLGW